MLLAGAFFGGALDHIILGLLGRVESPYGLHVGIGGNWIFAALDAVLGIAALAVYRRLQRAADKKRRPNEERYS